MSGRAVRGAGKPTVVLWDLDGTLLTTARAGIKALEDAVWEVLAIDVDLADLQTAGMTDRAIATAILALVGREADEATAARLLQVYTSRLPHRLLERRGHVMPGVVEVLDALTARPDVVLSLLTGNMSQGAAAKLASYGLDGYFTDGGFADDGYDRTRIGRALLERLDERHGVLDRDRVFLVGDTPSDVATADDLGVRAIAVATGTHRRQELEELGAWRAYDRLPLPDAFLSLVGLR